MGFVAAGESPPVAPGRRSLSFAGTNESNQSKVPERQPFEFNASARRFGCCVDLLTRHLEALSTPQVLWADEPVMEQSGSSSTELSFQPCNSVGSLAFGHFALPPFICASK